MPLFTYRCPDGHEFDSIVPVAKRDDLQPCPHTRKGFVPDAMAFMSNAAVGTKFPACTQLATRKGVELNAKSFPGADSWRKK